MDFRIRLMCAEDIVAADHIRALVGWNQRPADWQRLLNYEPSGCFVGLIDDRVIGTVTTTCYGDALAWIGMMLVHPDYRRRGVGRQLMTAALDYLQGRALSYIRLDATPAGRPLYEKLGFQAEWSFQRWGREPRPFENLSNGSKFATESDELAGGAGQFTLSDHSGLDRVAFGCSRMAYLERLVEDSRIVVSGQGFGMLRGGSVANYLGPVVAASPEEAKCLIARLVAHVSEQIYWDVPEPNRAAVGLAADFQFRPQRQLVRMRLGAASVPSSVTADLDKQFALADPGTG